MKKIFFKYANKYKLKHICFIFILSIFLCYIEINSQTTTNTVNTTNTTSTTNTNSSSTIVDNNSTSNITNTNAKTPETTNQIVIEEEPEIIKNYKAKNFSVDSKIDYRNFSFDIKYMNHQIDLISNNSQKTMKIMVKNLTDDQYTKKISEFRELKTKIDTLCMGLKQTLKENSNYSDIKTIFPKFIDGLRSKLNQYFKKENFTLNENIQKNYFYWIDNIRENDNIEEDVIIYYFTLSQSEIMFPILLIGIFAVIFFCIFNCLYCKFCYVFCFRKTKTLKTMTFFSGIFALLFIMTFLSIATFLFLQMRTQEIKNLIEYLGCEYSNRNIMTFLDNIDYAKGLGINGTRGLDSLKNDYERDFISDLKDFQFEVFNSTYIKKEEPLLLEKIDVLKGLSKFQNYIKNNSFTEEDDNGKFKKIYQLTYKCDLCKSYLQEIENIGIYYY